MTNGDRIADFFSFSYFPSIFFLFFVHTHIYVIIKLFRYVCCRIFNIPSRGLTVQPFSRETDAKMGRKKIQISRITDERNRQVSNCRKRINYTYIIEKKMSGQINNHCFIYILAGDVQQAKIRSHEEGVRAVRPVRLRDRPDNI